MPVDLWDTTVWPSPSPETDVRSRVEQRTATLRRRRSLPAMAVAAALMLGVAAWPQPESTTGLAAEGNAVKATDEGLSSEGRPAADEAPPQTPGVPSDSDPIVSSDVPEAVERATKPHSFPTAATFSTAHPLLRDAEGDAYIEHKRSDFVSTSTDSAPSLDVTALDVRADAQTVTTELRLLDLTAPPPRIAGRDADAQRYRVVLSRPDNTSFSFELVRETTGHVWAAAAYWTPTTGGGISTASGTDVGGVTGTFDSAQGLVRVTATFDAMNQAVAAAPGNRQPVGLGSPVVPYGETQTTYASYGHWLDTVRSDNPSFAYNLGD